MLVNQGQRRRSRNAQTAKPRPDNELITDHSLKSREVIAKYATTLQIVLETMNVHRIFVLRTVTSSLSVSMVYEGKNGEI